MYNIHFNLTKCRILSFLASARDSPHYIITDGPPQARPKSSTVSTLFYLYNKLCSASEISLPTCSSPVYHQSRTQPYFHIILNLRTKIGFPLLITDARRHCSCKLSFQKTINTGVARPELLLLSRWIARLRKSLTWALASSAAWVKNLKLKMHIF